MRASCGRNELQRRSEREQHAIDIDVGRAPPVTRRSIRHPVAALVAVLAVVLMAGAAGPVAAQTRITYRVDAGYTSDDNVSRSFDYTKQARADQSVFADLNASMALPLSQRVRLILGGVAGVEKFFEFDGLSKASVGGSANLQFRPSGSFGAPTWSLFARTAADSFDSNLRDGYRHSFGLQVRKPLTDAIEASVAAQYNIRDGKSIVFDNKEWAAKLNVDYNIFGRSTLYFGAEYRNGDTVSSGPISFGILSLADALVFDDVFTDRNLVAYKLKAETLIGTIGYNMPIGQRYALDLSYRYVRTTPSEQTSAIAVSNPRYTANLITLSFLVRF